MNMTPDGKSSAPDSDSDIKGSEGKRSVSVIDNCIQSRDLFASTREITIAHGSDVYRLRLTSQNKLILTK